MQKVSIIAQAKRKNTADTMAVIVIRGFYNRKPVASLSTGNKIRFEHWDPIHRCVVKNAPNAALINGTVKMKLQGIEEALLKQQICGHTINQHLVKRAVKGLNESTDFIKFCKNIIERDFQNKETKRTYLSELTKLEQFRPNIGFSDIDHSFLQAYKNYMKNTLENADNTVWKTFKFMNGMINLAINTGGIIQQNPFDQFNRGKYVQPKKQALSIIHCDAIEKMLKEDNCDPILRMVGYRFLLMAYSGMRFADAKIFDPAIHVTGDHITMQYSKCKTDVNNKMYPRLKRIVDIIAQYPLSLSNQKFNPYLKLIAMHCEIPFRLTSHVGRHTMGSMLAMMEVPPDQAALILGHRDRRSTNIYYHQHIENIDKSMDKLGGL